MTTLIKQNLRIIVVFVILYLGNKFFLRPYIVSNNVSGILEIITFSFPNFCEAVVGSLFLTNVGLTLSEKFPKTFKNIPIRLLFLGTVFIAGVYVILQEFKVHNLGGVNVFDLYDVLFSCLGLGFVFLYLMFMTPKKTFTT